MKNIRDFLSENFQFLEVKFSIYLNRHIFVMCTSDVVLNQLAHQRSLIRIFIIRENKHFILGNSKMPPFKIFISLR